MKILLLSICLGLFSLNAFSQSKLLGAGKGTKVGASTTSKTPTINTKHPTAKKPSTSPTQVKRSPNSSSERTTTPENKMQRSFYRTDNKESKEEMFKKAYSYWNSKDYVNSFPLFKTLADEEYEEAYGYMGLAYELGEGVSKDSQMMEKYFELAIHNGSGWCAYRLGNYYYKHKEYQKALKNYQICGEKRNGFRSDALYKAGSMYENGEGTDKSIVQAILYYRKSAQYSNSLYCDARRALQRLGETVEKKEDFVEASTSMTDGLTGKEMYEKGYDYEIGLRGENVSLTKAYSYYKAAADVGYAKACVKMGEIYTSRNYPFNDKLMADEYYAKAINAYKKEEATSGEACYELGRIYQYGNGVEINIEQAKYYYKVGSSFGEKNASWRYGLICKDENAYSEAYTFFLKAADAGQGMAMYEVAELYEKGLGVVMSKEKAIEWYSKCAKSNYASASDAKRALRRLGIEESK